LTTTFRRTLEEINPPQEEILQDLKLELGADLVVPVFFGVAEQDWRTIGGATTEAPEPETTAERRGITSMLMRPWLKC